jgi:hypothetical protein
MPKGEKMKLGMKKLGGAYIFNPSSFILLSYYVISNYVFKALSVELIMVNRSGISLAVFILHTTISMYLDNHDYRKIFAKTPIYYVCEFINCIFSMHTYRGSYSYSLSFLC